MEWEYDEERDRMVRSYNGFDVGTFGSEHGRPGARTICGTAGELLVIVSGEMTDDQADALVDNFIDFVGNMPAKSDSVDDAVDGRR